MNFQRSNSISTASSSTTTRHIVPLNHHFTRSASSSSSHAPPHHLRRHQNNNVSNKLLIPKHNASTSSPLSLKAQTKNISSLLRSFLNLITFPATFINLPAGCKWLAVSSRHRSVTPTLGRKVTGTLFGNRRGHVSFAVQLDPTSEPVLLLELAMSTSSLVREMSSGLVRIALESEKHHHESTGCRNGRNPLFQEPTWTMYCNGRKVGQAASRTCGESDWHVLTTVRSVSVGAGVIPVVEDGNKKVGEGLGELLYMRARFERVVGSRDSEAFYMLNPDGSNGGPELSIFLLRI